MSRARDLSKLGNPGIFSVSADNNVGVNSTAPVEKLNVVGVVSASAFYGDGSQLEGVASAGLGTAVVSNSPYGGEQIYYTNKALNITGDLTVDVPDSAEVAYTQYQEIVVDSGADFIVGDGDDFIPDILGIGTEVQQPGLLAGGGGRVRADNFSDKSGTGAPTFSSGVVVTGVATATSFSGNATGLTGTPDITVGDITATGNVSIGGTLTYEDVTNIDSVGLITARNGIEVAGIITAKAGAALTYYGDGSGLTFAPKVIAYDPAALSTGISTTTNITFTFDQNIQFAGTGTIEVRETSNSGTIATSFAISGGTAPTGLSIVNNQLIINPTEPLSLNTVHYVVLPSAGIANAQGSYYAGSNGYNFQTVNQAALFSASGGNESFTVEDSNSPTGYYKYHVFSSPGPFTLGAPTASADSFTSMLIGGGGAGRGSADANGGGGGGAGGLIKHTGPTLNLASGSYTITIGAGAPYTDTNGQDSTINLDGNPVLTAYGGGRGGLGSDGISGGSGGGASCPVPSGTLRIGGTGVSGQGYAGSNSGPHTAANIGVHFGAGGGGAGGTGSSGSSSGATTPYTIVAGNGGPGSANPEFNATVLSPRVTSIPAPSWGVIGSSGLYAGGGGGSTGYSPQQTSYSGGLGGPGGGGNGIQSLGHGLQPGFANTGGGGGAGGPGNGGSGGSGVFMVRYATPSA